MFCYLVLGVICTCVVLAWRRRLQESRAHALPPAYPGELPIIGHLHLWLTKKTSGVWQLLKSAAENCVEHGGVTYCKIGDLYYLIADPEDALTVANTCLKKHFAYSFIKSWLGDGLVTSSGEIWHRHRKMLNPMFTLPMIHGFLEVFNSQAKGLVSKFDPYVEQGPFNPSSHIRNMALKVSCLTAFGTDDRKDKSFFSKYMKAVDEIMFILMQRFLNIYQQSDWIYGLLGLKEKEAELVNTLRKMSDEIIKKKKALFKNGKINEYDYDDQTTSITYKPFLDLILQQASKEAAMTDQEIINEVDTTIVAGFETSSHLLDYIMVMIGSYPEVQERMYTETVEVLGEEKDVEKEDLRKLVYTEAVIKETLRLFPVIPAISRYIDRDVKLKNCTLRANSQCLILLNGVNFHPSWGSDADQFRPERWLDAASLPKNSNSFASFSLGKRSCIGRTYAMTSVKVALAHVIRKFHVTADYTKLQLKLDGMLKPVAGNEISIQRRQLYNLD